MYNNPIEVDMQYLITFLEGMISFISPCILPLLPVYVSYFAGDAYGNNGEPDGKAVKSRALVNSVAFVAGFTVVFSMLGVFAGVLSSLLNEHIRVLQLISGLIIILFGLACLGVIKIPELSASGIGRGSSGVIGSFLFGMVYSVSIAPCAGAFLGSALAMAGASGTAVKGLTLLIAYSLGLGIPFIMSAVLIDRLKTAFDLIKRNYKVINTVSGVFLIAIGVLMMTGHLGNWMAMLA